MSRIDDLAKSDHELILRGEGGCDYVQRDKSQENCVGQVFGTTNCKYRHAETCINMPMNGVPVCRLIQRVYCTFVSACSVIWIFRKKYINFH